MAASIGSPASDSDMLDTPHKANSANQPHESSFNGASRVVGLDGAADDRGYKYRPLSRSPSPYRRKPTRSRSRSPSPYRNRRAVDRSPSPYRHGGRTANRRHDDYDARAYPKRKTSPPRGPRPEKRHHADRGRTERPASNLANGARHAPPQSHGYGAAEGPQRLGGKPISYAELEKPHAVPDFRDNLPTTSQSRGSDTTNRPRDRTRLTASRESAATTSGLRATTAQPNQQQDVEMKFASNDIDWTPAPIEDQVPTEESREEKRRRWAAKRAAAEQTKLSQNLHQQAVLTNAAEVTKSNAMSSAHRTETSTSPVVTSHDGDVDSVPTSPDVMVLDKQHGDSEANSPAADSPAAADYDPMQDMLDDQERAASKNQTAQLSSAAPQGADPKALSILPVEKAVVPRKQKKELDMFASDDEDEDEELVQEERGGNKGTILDERLLDNWTDGNNYYKIINNELVNNGRYRMVRSLGQGVFANVAQAEDQKAETDDPSRKIVAIKIIRKIEFMRKASQKEIDFLRRANDADPHDKWHIIRLLGSFDHKGHLCIVFEHMSKNLRDLLKEETSNRGLTLSAVRIYAKQMFYGLQHLQNCQIIHFDLKPDNVLVSADRKTVKLADFGTAVDKRDILERNEYTVSRFYRAPEIILGWDVSYPVDMWAVACTIFELWTGRILFQGRSNNQMVKAFLDIMGWPSEKLLNKGNQANVFTHFDFNPSLTFFSREVDKQGQLVVRKLEPKKKIKRDLKIRVHEAAQDISSGGPTTTELNDLADLLSSCLNLNVEKRMSPKDATSHRFFGSKNAIPRSAVVKPPMMKRGIPGTRR